MLNQTNIVKEIDKVIDFVKEVLLNEADEDKIFELSVLRYALVKHKKEKSHNSKIHFEYGDDVEFIHYLLSKNNIELLEKLGWTVIHCAKDGEPLGLNEISEAVKDTVKRKLFYND